MAISAKQIERLRQEFGPRARNIVAELAFIRTNPGLSEQQKTFIVNAQNFLHELFTHPVDEITTKEEDPDRVEMIDGGLYVNGTLRAVLDDVGGRVVIVNGDNKRHPDEKLVNRAWDCIHDIDEVLKKKIHEPLTSRTLNRAAECLKSFAGPEPQTATRAVDKAFRELHIDDGYNTPALVNSLIKKLETLGWEITEKQL